MASDYYQTLELDSGATREQVKETYRKLAFQYHPDRNPDDPNAAQKMKDLNEAYAVLSDTEKRRKYDALRASYGSSAYRHFREDYTEEDIFRSSDIDQILEHMAQMFGFRGFEELFKEFYGSKYQSFEFRRPGYYSRGFVFWGHRRPEGKYDNKTGEYFSREHAPRFPRSPFTGILNRFLQRSVEKALGIKFPVRGKDLYDTIFLSAEQARNGGAVEYSLRKWGSSRKIKVKIPCGIKNGQKIKLKGLGAEGKGGGEAGDLFLDVKIKEPLLQRIKGFLQQVRL